MKTHLTNEIPRLTMAAALILSMLRPLFNTGKQVVAVDGFIRRRRAGVTWARAAARTPPFLLDALPSSTQATAAAVLVSGYYSLLTQLA